MQNVRETLRNRGLHAKKNFGQNFLVDERVKDKIISAADVGKSDFIIEIGAGTGSITAELCRRAWYVAAYEIDRDLIPVLVETLAVYDNVSVINEDVLKADIFGQPRRFGFDSCKIVANLPYYITSQVIFMALRSKFPVASMTFTVQKEFALKLLAKPSESDYCAFTVYAGFYSDVIFIANAPRNCFMPRPGVDSAVIRLDPRRAPSGADEETEKVFLLTVKAAFSKRRKTLVNCLAEFQEFADNGYGITKESAAGIVKNLGFPENIRGEALAVGDFAALADEIRKTCRL